MKGICNTAIITITLQFSLFSQQFITGEISGLLKPGDYIISGTVYVLRNQKLQIAPGTKLYFEQFSSLTVLGEIRCDGTQTEPVTFSSVKEYLSSKQDASPDVFDWNGIEITSEATFVDFDFAEIRNCIFGLKIKSGSTKVRLNNVTFSNIGYSCISKSGNLVEVKNDVPYSCLWNIDSSDACIQTYIRKTADPQTKTDTVSQVKSAIADTNKPQHLSLQQKKLILSGVTACTIGSCVTFISSSIKRRQTATRYTEQKLPEYALRYRERYNSYRIVQYTSGSLMALCAVGTFITILF